MISAKKFAGSLLEDRPVHTFDVAREIKKIPGLKVVDMWSYADGTVLLARMEDGQAYEIKITPATNPGVFQPFKEKYGAGRGWTKKPKVPYKREPEVLPIP